MKTFYRKFRILFIAVFTLIALFWAQQSSAACDPNVGGPGCVQNPEWLRATQEAAQKQQTASTVGNTVGGVLAGAAIAPCASCASVVGSGSCWLCGALVAGSATSFIAANHNWYKAGGSQYIEGQITNNGGQPPPGGNNGNGSGNPIPGDVSDNLAKAGAIIDLKNGTVTMPNGKKDTIANLTSPDLMKKLTPAEQAALKKAHDDANKKADAALAALGDSDGVGVGGKLNGSDIGGGRMPASFGLGNKPTPRGPAQIAGLTTTYNGSAVGVASDSIFGMIDRRYDLHQRQGSFLLGPTSAAPVVPASGH